MDEEVPSTVSCIKEAIWQNLGTHPVIAAVALRI